MHLENVLKVACSICSLCHVKYIHTHTVCMFEWLTYNIATFDRSCFRHYGDDDDHFKPRNVYGHLEHQADYAGKMSNSIRILTINIFCCSSFLLSGWAGVCIIGKSEKKNPFVGKWKKKERIIIGKLISNWTKWHWSKRGSRHMYELRWLKENRSRPSYKFIETIIHGNERRAKEKKIDWTIKYVYHIKSGIKWIEWWRL